MCQSFTPQASVRFDFPIISWSFILLSFFSSRLNTSFPFQKDRRWTRDAERPQTASYQGISWNFPSKTSVGLNCVGALDYIYCCVPVQHSPIITIPSRSVSAHLFFILFSYYLNRNCLLVSHFFFSLLVLWNLGKTCGRQNKRYPLAPPYTQLDYQINTIFLWKQKVQIIRVISGTSPSFWKRWRRVHTPGVVDTQQKGIRLFGSLIVQRKIPDGHQSINS